MSQESALGFLQNLDLSDRVPSSILAPSSTARSPVQIGLSLQLNPKPSALDFKRFQNVYLVDIPVCKENTWRYFSGNTKCSVAFSSEVHSPCCHGTAPHRQNGKAKCLHPTNGKVPK